LCPVTRMARRASQREIDARSCVIVEPLCHGSSFELALAGAL
jgi:hypothetical protein